jgi:hypothetical protein
MSIYSHILDPIVDVDHPDITPRAWTLEPELGGE